MPRKALTQDLSSATVRFLRINADQTVSELTAAQMLAAIESGSRGRVSLGADVTRSSSDTLSNTGLSALDVPVEANAHYLLKYRLWTTQAGVGGWQFGHEWPASPSQMSGNCVASGVSNSVGFLGNVSTGQDYPAQLGASGDAVINTSSSSGSAGVNGDYALIEFTIDFYNGANAGTFKLLFAQESSAAAVTTLKKTSSVEWVRFP